MTSFSGLYMNIKRDVFPEALKGLYDQYSHYSRSIIIHLRLYKISRLWNQKKKKKKF